MRSRFVGSILPVVVIPVLTLSLSAQTDLSGIWDSGGNRSLGGPGERTEGPADSRGGIPVAGFTKMEPPMTEAALRIYRPRRVGRRPTDRAREEADPSFYPYCMPRTFPRIYNFDPLVEIVQTPQVVYMMFETDHQMRRIYMDDRKHLAGWHPTFMGTSHGHWEGETLVVETENILSLDNQGWLDTLGHPFTEALQVTERIRRPDQNNLVIDFVFDDPGAYTRPWNGQKVFVLRTGVDMTDTSFCEQHQQEDYLQDIRAGTPKGQPW